MKEDSQPQNKTPLTLAELEYRFSAMGLKNSGDAWEGDTGVLIVFQAAWALPNLLIKRIVRGNVLYFSDYKWKEAIDEVMKAPDQD